MSEYGALTFGDALRSVLATLPEQAELDILVAPQARAAVAEWVIAASRTAPVHLHTAPEGLAFSLWTQDYFLARTDGSLVLPPSLNRFHDDRAAAFLGQIIDSGVTTAMQAFEGGNLLAIGEWLLIGGDTEDAVSTGALDPSRRAIVLSCAEPAPGEETLTRDSPAPGWQEKLRYRSDAGSLQPVFHLDLFIAPAGQAANGLPRVLVGCPVLGAKILNHPVPAHADAARFDEIAAQLTRQGADVIRNPMPLICKDHTDRKTRIWYHLPVNNVLVEQVPGQSGRVWLPCFAQPPWAELEAIDDANAEIWSDLGFTVTRVPNMLGPAENLGSLHCMAKVVARDERRFEPERRGVSS